MTPAGKTREFSFASLPAFRYGRVMPADGFLPQSTSPASQPPASPAEPQPKHSYRPEIDGLRAVAILPVLFYHAGLGFPGGYVGVDVFFVISGFLITSLIFKELETGTFSLANFWARRARRIVPASLTLTFTVLLAGWFLFLPRDYKGLGNSAGAQAVFASNVYFWATVDYFQPTVNLLPLLHTWSLAVEEQFYVGFPLLLLAGYRVLSWRRRGLWLGIFAGGAILSLAWSVHRLAGTPTAAFYLLPSRAWELLAGSFLALCPAAWTPSRRGWREAGAALGMAGIVFAVFGYDAGTLFPGLAALPPCLGAALIIWSNGVPAGSGGGRPGLTVVGRMLASPVPVFIGLISYSLYLWHWPLLSFSVYLLRAPLPIWGRWLLVAASLGAAVLSWRVVETPFRVRRVFASRRSILLFAGLGLMATLVAGFTIRRLNGVPARVPAPVIALTEAMTDLQPFPQLTTAEVRSGHLTPFGVDRPDAPPQLFLWGDSHAAAILPAMDLYAKRHGLVGRAALHSNTAPLLDYWTRADFGLNEEAVPFGRAVFDYIQRNHIPRVVLADYWTRDLRDPGKLEAAFGRTVEQFKSIDVKLYVLLQVPSQPVDVPRALALDAWWPRWKVEWRARVEEHRRTQALLYRLADKYRAPNCVFIDPAPVFADPDGQHFQAVRDGHPLYADGFHMSGFCSANLFEPVLERKLDGP